jgi:hypothetical protein
MYFKIRPRKKRRELRECEQSTIGLASAFTGDIHVLGHLCAIFRVIV